MPTTLLDRTTRHPLARPAMLRRVGLALLAVLAAWGVLGPPAEAAQPCHVPGDFATIQDAVDDDACTTINVAAGTYKELITIDRDVTLRGDGQGRTVLDGNLDGKDDGDGTVVTITPDAVVTISGVTIQGGSASAAGGGIINRGTLTLENSTVAHNRAETEETEEGVAFGGGIWNLGTLTVRNSTVTHNSSLTSTVDGTTYGRGGGLHNDVGSTLTLENSTVAHNSTGDGGNGGGLGNFGGPVTIRNSTITGNTSGEGGGLGNFGGPLTIHNSTITGNTATGAGGGLANDPGAVTIQNSTVTGNTAPLGGDIYNNSFLRLTRVTVGDCFTAPEGNFNGCPVP